MDEQLFIGEDVFIVPYCWVCARPASLKDPPDIIDGMSKESIRTELCLEDDEVTAEELFCVECGCLILMSEGAWLRHVPAADALGLAVPSTAKARRIREKLREFLRRRDRRTCRICGEILDIKECTGHHIVAWSRGGPTSAENLVIACKECQKVIDDRTLPKRRIVNTEFVRELSANEMEHIANLEYTEEELDEHLQRLLKVLNEEKRR